MADNNAILLNQLFSLLLKKIVVPTEYHDQVSSIKDMLKDDVSGLIDSLTDFAVDSATVDYDIETENDNFSEILKEWLNTLNMAYQGKIPTGVKPLAKEYFKERWKYSSFPVLKIGKWEEVNGVILPTQMYFVDGGSIYAKDKDEKNNELQLLNYDYYLGRDMKHKLDKNAIFAKCNGRWFDKYPIPYLVKRGVYHNYKIVQSLKDKETTILDQIIPYLLLIKKGTEGLAISGAKTYSDEELKQVIAQFQSLMNEIRSQKLGDKTVKTPTRAVNFDETLDHIIPDLSTIFDRKLFEQAERNILAGLGFIDVVEAVSTSRRESILNPKVFIDEVRTGVEDFKQILKELIIMIIQKNKSHRKWTNTDFYISSSPIKAFQTDDFKEKIRQLYDRGIISKRTAVELIGEVDFRTEVYRREKEVKEGLEETLYPPVIQNREAQGIDLPGTETTPEEETEENKPEDKKGIEKENYNRSKDELETAPYNKISDLPAQVRDNMSSSLQSVFMRVFNNALKQYKNETRAFKIAWGVIRKIAKKNKNGKWVKKASRIKASQELINEIVKAIEEDESEK